MSLFNTQPREIQLFLILKFCSKTNPYLSDVDRIYINQERAGLMANNSAIELDEPKLYNNQNNYSKELQNKIDFIIEKINNNEKLFSEMMLEIKTII